MNEGIRNIVRQRAKYLCEYCHSPEKLSASRFTVDHLIPQSLGGTDNLENLALACRRCNERRYNFVAGIDPQSKQIEPLFQPRTHQWSGHFCWEKQGTLIKGITPIGRATCQRLDLNDDRYPVTDSIQATRQLWVKAGWHPPSGDPYIF